ncbi:CaiB/BaiF CoA transferase family protein [Brevibacterium aurantiacum]|uniref:CaiB/BaiF CoA transferase family protein n=1 Tax=Brevibacterium aurantiacum TaxID=273384 RepID=UPI001868DEE9|nr:CoA transferase [Brevibacterium aurantiacum]
MSRPLEGIRVLELGLAIAGPHCTQILSDQGADVIKIESPAGDRTRHARPMLKGESVYFAAHNRGKRSVCLDLKTDEGLNALKGLAATADILVTNFGGTVPERLGWSYQTLKELNPMLVFVHITGFGAQGNKKNVPAYDGTIQAMSGLPALTGHPEGGPMLSGAFVADHIAAQHGAMGALLGLQTRERTGEGTFVDISMFDAYFSLLAHDVNEAATGIERESAGNSVPTCYSEAFEAKDGLLFIAVLEQQSWDRLCVCIGRKEWVGAITYQDDAMGWRRESINRVIAEWVAKQTREEAMKALNEARVACGAFRSVAEVVADEVANESPMVRAVETPGGQTVLVPGRPIRLGTSAESEISRIPALGESTEQILNEIAGGASLV